MPHQRTITVYERIPLDEIYQQLNADELLLAHTLNEFIDETYKLFSSDFEMCRVYSWDEILLAPDGSFVFGRMINRCIMALIYSNDSHFGEGEEDIELVAENFRAFYDEHFREVINLILDDRLCAANKLALQYWFDFHLKDQDSRWWERSFEMLRADSNELSALIDKLIDPVEGTETKNKLVDNKCFAVIKRVLAREGFDWKTVDLGKGTITLKELHHLCHKEENTFFLQALASFRTSTWTKFNAHREYKG